MPTSPLMEKLAFESLCKVMDELPKLTLPGTAIKYSQGLTGFPCLRTNAVKYTDILDEIQRRYQVGREQAVIVIDCFFDYSLLGSRVENNEVYCYVR